MNDFYLKSSFDKTKYSFDHRVYLLFRSFFFSDTKAFLQFNIIHGIYTKKNFIL